MYKQIKNKTHKHSEQTGGCHGEVGRRMSETDEGDKEVQALNYKIMHGDESTA